VFCAGGGRLQRERELLIFSAAIGLAIATAFVSAELQRLCLLSLITDNNILTSVVGFPFTGLYISANFPTK